MIGAGVKTKRRGCVQEYDPGFVRDIAVQRLIAFYNERQETLRTNIERDPGYVSKLRDKAHFTDPVVRSWLDALKHVPEKHPNYQVELAFRYWCLRLEPPMPPEKLNALPEHEKSLRNLMERHFTEDYFRTNCRPWLDAIKRVREDNCVKLILPPNEDDDDWL